MLTLEPALAPGASRRPAGAGKLAIALAGGGPLGAFYEIGALHALGEAIVGRALTDFDVYVGVSSGALVAAGLANGFDTTTLGSTFIHDESTVNPFAPATLMRPALTEYARRVRLVPEVLAGIARLYSRDPLHSGWPGAADALGTLIPGALFDNGRLEHYLHAAFTMEGHTDDFRALARRLYVVATNLNTAESVSFGTQGFDRVPISRAVVASAALPGLYPPVRIRGHDYVDGALMHTMRASLAHEEGCRLVICINPLVPFDASRATGGERVDLASRGLPAVLGQTFRALIHSRMRAGMASYRTRFPQADTLLLEPDRHDERLFFANVFRYTGRRQLTDHAYQRTRADLLAQAGQLAPILRRHGLKLDMRLLRDRERKFSTSAKERRRDVRQVAGKLGGALDGLERLLTGFPGG